MWDDDIRERIVERWRCIERLIRRRNQRQPALRKTHQRGHAVVVDGVAGAVAPFTGDGAVAAIPAIKTKKCQRSALKRKIRTIIIKKKNKKKVIASLTC